HAQGQSGWTAINDDLITGAMADPGGGDAKQFAESITWHIDIITVPSGARAALAHRYVDSTRHCRVWGPYWPILQTTALRAWRRNWMTSCNPARSRFLARVKHSSICSSNNSRS